MSESQTTIPRSNVRFGEWLSRGFQAFGEQWQNWLVQMLIASGITLAATTCLILPVFLVLGPLSSGLHYCGLRAVRRQPVDGAALRRGWETAGQSMIAYIGVSFLHVFPGMVLYGLFMGAFFAMTMSGAMVPPGTRPMRPAGAPAIGIHVEDFTKVDKPKEIDRPRAAAQPVEQRAAAPGDQQQPTDEAPASKPEAKPEVDRAAEADLPPANDVRPIDDKNEALADPLAEDEQTGSSAAPAGGPVFPGPGMPGNRDLQFIGTIFMMYGMMFVGGLLMLLWTVWFGMRTMYVMPLIADRGCSFSEALTESWRLTKTSSWQLLLTYFLAFLIGSIGANFCYIGLVATLPIYFTIIASAYESHALPQFTPEDEDAPYGEPV